MGEKFRRAVNAPHQAFGRARKKITAMKPKTKRGKVARATGITMTGVFQFLLWAIKYAALDNSALRAGERALRNMKVGKNKNGENKKFPDMVKKYPNLSVHVISYLMFAVTVGGVRACHDMVGDKDSGPAVPRTEFARNTGDAQKARPGTYGAYLNRMQAITPLLIADLIAKEGVHTDERGMHTPYLDSKGVPTIGFGSTVLSDGSKVTMDTPPITTQQAYDLAKWHLERGETFFVMYCYDAAFDKVDVSSTGEAFAMASIIYNSYNKLIEDPDDKNCRTRFEELRRLYAADGLNVTDGMVRGLFKKYPVTSLRSFGKQWLGGAKPSVLADSLGNFLAGGRGMYWRRWLEAGLITGDITPDMMLRCPANGMYEFFKVMGQKKGAFFTGDGRNIHINKKTYGEFKKWLQNPVNEKGEKLKWKRVRDVLPTAIRGQCDRGWCALGENKKTAAAFAKSAKKVGNNAHSADFDVSGFVFDEHTMA